MNSKAGAYKKHQYARRGSSYFCTDDYVGKQIIKYI